MRYEEFRVKERLYYPSTSSKNTELEYQYFHKIISFLKSIHSLLGQPVLSQKSGRELKK